MNLDKLLELAGAATPGPWRSLVTGSEGCSVVADAPANRIGFGRVARLTARSPDEDQANAAYIAAASPEVVTALVRVAQAAQDWIDATEYAAAAYDYATGWADDAEERDEKAAAAWERFRAALRAALAEVTG